MYIHIFAYTHTCAQIYFLHAFVSLSLSLSLCALLGREIASKDNGQVATWGVAGWGGDSSAVHAKLLDVVDMAASNGAFAALRADGKAGVRKSPGVLPTNNSLACPRCPIHSRSAVRNRGSGISDLPSKELPVSATQLRTSMRLQHVTQLLSLQS